MEQPQLDNRPQPLQNEAVAEGARDGLRYSSFAHLNLEIRNILPIISITH